MVIEGVDVIAVGFEPELAELKNYVEFVESRVDIPVKKIVVTLCDDNHVDIDYIAKDTPFERIRRITGYLTGDLTSWNNAKQSEERDRVKHDTRI